MFLGRINMTRKTKVMTLTKITIIPIISINHFLIIVYADTHRMTCYSQINAPLVKCFVHRFP